MSFVLTKHQLPPRLAAIHDPPARLWLEGSVDALIGSSVAVVGSRRCSPHARNFAETIGAELARLGFVVVSGLAYGIDAAAHTGALSVGGTTLAVLGSGVDVVYPTRHRSLARRIVASHGALISEYPPGMRPRRHHFPARNRLISGVSIGVLVVEASNRSGSLITARMALEQGREVMAVPGIAGHPLAAGCHQLIRDGAGLVESVDDVLACLEYQLDDVIPVAGNRVPADAPPLEDRPEPGSAAETILEAVGLDVTTVDEIVEATRLAEATVVETLVHLEIDGLVEAHRHGYIRVPLVHRHR